MHLQHIYEKTVSALEDLIGVFYPRICAGCDAHLNKNEENLCLLCRHNLPLTYFWDYDVNPVEKLFWGRIPVHAACAHLHFEQGEAVQKLMHRLKYEGKTGIGTELGRMFGKLLAEKGWFADVDMVIPVPLHVSKETRRGYNQSTFIAMGMAESLGTLSSSDILKRVVASETQTRKSRYDRTENVNSAFVVVDGGKVRGKNILLVDDVVTTGATLSEAGASLVSAGVHRLYIATLATA